MDIKFYGTRGSYPQSGPDFVKAGGHTSCVRLTIDDQLFVIDAGSGMVNLHEEVLANSWQKMNLFLSHLHLDHIFGLPFFAGIWDPGFTFHIYSGMAQAYGGVRQCLERVFAPPFFPVPLAQVPSTIFFHDFKVGFSLHPAPGVTVKTIPLDHPNDACGFRFNYRDKSVVYLSDTAHSAKFMTSFERFCYEADVLIYDASFTPEEFEEKPTWGHSTWQMAAQLARKAHVKKLFLFHHAPTHTDAELADIERQTQSLFPAAELAVDGLEYTL
jgi:phosphoribosyl 1,2-cyclic phosphodiesterase